MKQKRLLLLLALLMTAATGAWAQVLVTHSNQSINDYGSLAEVFALSGDENANLQDGDVVTLLDDQTELTDILHLKNKQITLDLNGHTVSSSERVFNLTGSADLTLTSSQEGGTVNATFADTEGNHYAIRVGEGCKLTIPESSKHFTISSNNTCIFDHGKVVIAGSPTISGTKGGFYSVEATQPVELTISGSPTITSDGYGFLVLSPSCQLTISGAPTISGKVNGIFAYCPVTISGQPKISSQGAAGQMGAIVPYDIMAYQLTIGGKAEHPATLDFTGTKATGNIILYYPISITGPVALGSADKWNVTIMDSEGFPTTGTFTSGWTTNMTDAAIADYFTGGQLSDGTNLIVTTDADGEGALAPTYSVSLNDGTLNPTTWTAKAGEATTFSALPLKGVTEGQPVTLTYSGRMKVKSVTATTDAVLPTDLSKINAEYTVSNGETLTGTLASNVKISIAAGATVTLKDATINGGDDYSYKWAGLNCAGDATITLEGTNMVKGFYNEYPGIYVPSGKTLTIQGTGSLNARSNGYAAGIGGGYKIACGNITISGGTVEATGGDLAAGIGSGDKKSCGNISITGGTVTATGGKHGPGIGGGNSASCGNITIANTVTKVTATKGTDAPYSIGKGTNGTCGTVTIGGTVYWQDNAAVNTDANTYLAQATIVYPAPAATVVDLSTVSGDTYTVTGDVILTGTPTESSFDIKYGGDDYEVTLDNVNSAGSKRVSVVGSNHNINIKLKGTSRLMEIFTNTGATSGKTVTIGEAAAGGTLILTGSTEPIRAQSFTINGGTVKSQSTTGDNWAVYLNNTTVGVLTINGGALYLAAGQDGTEAVKGNTVSGTLYGWDGSAWVTYTNQRYATTDNTSGNPTGWTW